MHRFLLPLLILLLAGCQDRKVVSYEVPKEIRPEPAMSRAGRLSPADKLGGFHFEAPPHWEEQPASSMRLASYQVPFGSAPAADFSIIALPGSAGGALANVNRWRGQISLAPLTDSELTESVTVVDSGPFTYQVYEMISEDDILEGGHHARVIAAILEHDGTAWFFKLTGEDEAVAGEKTAFIELLKSFHFDEHP